MASCTLRARQSSLAQRDALSLQMRLAIGWSPMDSSRFALMSRDRIGAIDSPLRAPAGATHPNLHESWPTAIGTQHNGVERRIPVEHITKHFILSKKFRRSTTIGRPLETVKSLLTSSDAGPHAREFV